jgi:dihydrolipoamide dehydrogenase
LGLASVGVDDDGFLEVDGRLRVVGAQPAGADTDSAASGTGGDGESAERPWLYALGDVNGRALLTHTAKYQARIAVADILSLAEGGKGADSGLVAEADVSPLLPPRVTFTDPQVAAVGLTEAGARELGIEVAVSETETSGTAGASFHGRGTAGTSRLVADTRRGVLVGATFVGFETAELLHAATVAIVGEVPIERLRHAIPAFPTRSEIWLSLLDQLP